jgi:DNA-binding beta-propeller fold protein YncE
MFMTRSSIRRVTGRVLAALVSLTPLAVSAASPPPATAPYAVVERWTLDGAGGWDYLTIDSPRHRLFITRGDRVEVVDTQSGSRIGRIADTGGVHGVALAPQLKRGYTSNGQANTITEFDYDTLAVIRTMPVAGANPDAILYEPTGRHLYTFNGRSKDVTVYDIETLSLVATLPMPGKPEFAVDDGHGHIYVNIENEQGQLVMIDSIKLATSATWSLPGCASPTGLALDRVRARLYSVCDGKVMVVTNALTGAQVAKVPVGDGPDAVAYDDEAKRVFSSNGEGNLTVVDAKPGDKFRVVGTVPTQRGARTMAFDPVTRRVYVVTSAFGAAPPATAEHPHPRPQPVPGTFTVLVLAPR